MAAKLAIYMQAGVRVAWVAWPSTKTSDVWRPASPTQPVAILHESGLLDGLDVIPGFQILVRDIFAI
jgi:hypothetical protein